MTNARMRTGASGRSSVGVLSVPWIGVPPKGGSVSTVVHETTRRLADRFDFSIVGGATGRIPANEIPGIKYCALSDWADRRLFDNWTALRDRFARQRKHLYHRRSYHPSYARRAAAWLERAGCETVLVHEFPQWLPVVRRRMPDAVLVFWAHSATMVEGRQDALREYLNQADGLVGCSSFITRRIEEQVPALCGRGRVIYNGFDPERFAPDPSYGRAADLLAFVGRVTPEKGVHVLVDAFRRLAETRPSLELVVAGPPWVSDPAMLAGTDPGHLREIEALPRAYQAELVRRAGPARDRLHIVGSLHGDDLIRLYQRCTALVLPALWEEPFGMPVVEAMACGAPAVISQRGGLPELVDDCETGLVVPSGDVEALASALARLLENPSERVAMGEHAARVAHKRFPWSCSARSLVMALTEERPIDGVPEERGC